MEPEPHTTLEEVRRLASVLLAERPGPLKLCDALVRVAAEIAVPIAGQPSTAAWLERIARDVRRGDV